MIQLMILILVWIVCGYCGYRGVRTYYREHSEPWTVNDRNFFLGISLLTGPIGLLATMIIYGSEKESRW